MSAQAVEGSKLAKRNKLERRPRTRPWGAVPWEGGGRGRSSRRKQAGPARSSFAKDGRDHREPP